jgi:hypothetical protein
MFDEACQSTSRASERRDDFMKPNEADVAETYWTGLT